MLKIVQAHRRDAVQKVRLLLREYAASLDFDLCFQGFDQELAQLPGEYAPPEGQMLLALLDGQAAGCVALRRLEAGVAEMKRLYVRPQFRRLGIGRALVVAIIGEARKIGCTLIRLDTAPSMIEASSLYQALGFKEIPPYRHNPIPGALFMELDLREASL